MAANKAEVGKPGRTRINVNEEDDLRDWAGQFYISPDQLKEVIAKVGPMVTDVQSELWR